MLLIQIMFNVLRFPSLVLSRASLIPFAVSEHPVWQGELRAPSTQTTCVRRILSGAGNIYSRVQRRARRAARGSTRVTREKRNY